VALLLVAQASQPAEFNCNLAGLEEIKIPQAEACAT
jgi:hypothetical protein